MLGFVPTPLILFAPGAGAPSSSAWMQRWSERLESVGSVVTLDYPYMKAGRRSPDPLPKLIDAHREALREARAGHDVVVLAGKSMGGRVGCHLSLEERVSGLVCFGYPLKGASKRAPLRDEVLRSLTAPILFIQGTRDPLCPLDLLEETRPKMKSRNDLFVVQGGNHSLDVAAGDLKKAGEKQADVDDRILAHVKEFVWGLRPGR
jgi:predicted alpha/beta-hydrolase family hydrolase